MAEALRSEVSPFDLQLALDERAGQGLLRCRQRLGSPQGARILLGEREYLNFSSNDIWGRRPSPRSSPLGRPAWRAGERAPAPHLW